MVIGNWHARAFSNNPTTSTIYKRLANGMVSLLERSSKDIKGCASEAQAILPPR
jgi:hypothetical protein